MSKSDSYRPHIVSTAFACAYHARHFAPDSADADIKSMHWSEIDFDAGECAAVDDSGVDCKNQAKYFTRFISWLRKRDLPTGMD